MALDGIKRYWQVVSDLQQTIIDTQQETLDAVAAAMTDTIVANGRIFLFGTGHSHIMCEEGHTRAGSLAPFVPILFSSAMLHEGSILSGKIERIPGLAEPLLDMYRPAAGDMLFIFSNSGVNQMPVEMALAAKARDMTVVAVCSFAYARVAPLSTIGKRLDEVTDFALDNKGVPGDSRVQIDGVPWRVGPTSTIAGILILNSLVTEVAFRLHAQGHEVPVYASFNMLGGDEHNQQLFARWRPFNPHI